MNDKGNIILITGRNAVGKTTASKHLRDKCVQSDLFCEDKTISDALSLLKTMQGDDEQGGFHHTHNWCESKEYNRGHSHRLRQPVLPFTVLDNTLPDAMLLDFFTELSEIPQTNIIYIAEWAAGSNTNPKDTSASEIDYSYEKVRGMLEEEKLPVDWLTKVHSVIHLTASDENRCLFNEQRYVPCLEEMLDGTTSWPIQRKILQFYGYDDFSEIEDVFRDRNIPIFEIANDGSSALFEKKLDSVFRRLFTLSHV